MKFAPLDPKIIPLIIKHAPKAGELIVKQAQKIEAVNKILQDLDLNPTQIPDDVDLVYVYALVEYGVFKPEAILNVLRKKRIKDNFWKAYTSNSPFQFLENTKDFLKEHQELERKILINRLDLSAELEEFGEVFISVAKRTASGKFKPYPDWDLDVFPKEFKALILEKTRLFCGREFVFEAFDKFLQTKPKGYFTVIGDAGMGKSAIASKYILERKVLCYFNIFAEGRNKPKQFLASIRQQLIKRYGLQNEENSDLPTLLQEASEELSEEEKLVIVVDALDEVDKEGDGNLLDLPQNLPDGVYFFLTRRLYSQENKRLTVSSDTPYDELDLRKGGNEISSREDVKEYIHLFLRMDKSEIKRWIQELLKKQDNGASGEVITLDQWRQEQDPPFSQIEFENLLAEKSQNNFMYLRYVLPDIATGKYKDLSLKGLPEGLQEYYITHWKRMGMDQDNKDINVKILFILVVRGDAVSSDMIADILYEDISPIEEILDQWIEYVTPKKVEEDRKEKTYYTIYHRSFLDFLTKRPKLDQNKNKKRFQDVINKIDIFLDIDF
ncbi:MAG: NACHT domain protein [Moorea sp. SIO2B7]|nr:NACHT domain protein [Moorena sp. SIO2B7]